ncbi:MAG: hypothetical protein WDM87_15730 [Terracidiphilus sp.]
MPTFRPPTASSAAKPPASFTWLCKLKPVISRLPSTASCPIPEDWSVLVERAQQPPDPAVPFIDLQQMQQQQQ